MATSPELDDKDIQAYVAAWKRRQDLRKKHLMELIGEARVAALTLAEILVSTYGASEVWLFGSLARSRKRPEVFGEHSDIDLAARGLPPEKYFHILSRINTGIDINVDLIDMDACPSWLLDTVTKEGELLAMRKEGSDRDEGAANERRHTFRDRADR